MDHAGCLEECGETQQEAAAAGCSAEFNALASCMLNGGSAAWDCDSSSDEMEPADTGPCASQLAALDDCEAGSDTTEGTGGGTGSLCTNTCEYANDGECDDGGPESLYDDCELGTDCADCGPL